jgi:hypothetical protein
MVGIKAEDMEDYITKDYNTENTIKVIIKTNPKEILYL